MNVFRILTTLFGTGACAALAWGGAQVSVLPADSLVAVAAVVALWISAGALGFVFVRAASGGGWLAYGVFVMLYLGAAATAVTTGHSEVLSFGPAVTLSVCIAASYSIDSPIPTQRQSETSSKEHATPTTSTHSAPCSIADGHYEPLTGPRVTGFLEAAEQPGTSGK